MKKLIASSSLVLFSAFAFADNQKAIEYYKYDLTNTAKKILLENLKSNTLNNTEQAEADFYLGEIYFSEQKTDSAKYYYKQGLNADPNYVYNTVGELKTQLKTDPAGAEKALNALLSKNKKDLALQTAVARAYLDNDLLDKASQQVEAAKKINLKYAPIYVVQGDIAAKKDKLGEAGKYYDNAIYYDSQIKEAYVKSARIYATLNYHSSISTLQTLAGIDKSSYLPYREIGDVYYKNELFADAAKAYGKYIENDKYSYENHPRYAFILFSNRDFAKSVEIAENALKADPNNLVLNRILIYNYYELKKHKDGVEAADKFVKTTPEKEFIVLDYIYYARLLAENKRREEAIGQYEAALKKDSTKVVLYKELAEVYDALGQYPKAIENYNVFIAKGKSQVTVGDYLSLGQSYYNEVTSDASITPELKAECSHVADSLFAIVIEKVPTNYLGYLWRARINSVLDPETELGLAKPYYEKLETLLNRDSAKEAKLLVEVYKYLGFYAYLKKDIPTSKGYWNKILEIDPNDKTAAEALKGM